ncbi:ATPase (plasmid) [Calothrix sp. NIES-4071]|nr:ATPase [Calothrix sp. NIES-4071]BAZ64595.1 ATPase [Calothrix sp. NIES-4105]
MPYEPIHLKYRPQTLSDVIGQETTTTTLQNAVTQQRIAPVYLFTGAKGTGKTSTARILAKMINCQSEIVPCNKCNSCININNSSHLDVIEIDAASNSGVDPMRDVIERTQFAPIAGAWKVIIIDECHSLSNQAWQSLLKTTEQPPENVTFVFCTTEESKVPPTIKSRAQTFEFKLISVDAIASALLDIARLEQFDLDLDAAIAISEAKNGHMRDSQTLLDQLFTLGKPITKEVIEEVCGIVNESTAYKILVHLATANYKEAKLIINSLFARGKSPHKILTTMVSTCLKYITYTDHPIKQVWDNKELQRIITTLSNKENLTKGEFSDIWIQAILMEVARMDLDEKFVPIYTAWKSEADAIAWGKQQLPNHDINAAWQNLERINGKKAPAWIYYVIREQIIDLV